MLQFFHMKPGSHKTFWGYRIALVILMITNLAALAWIVQSRSIPPDSPTASAQETVSPSITHTATDTPEPPTATNTVMPIVLSDGQPQDEQLRAQGVLVLSMRDGHYMHLFAYHPLYLPLARLTNYPWDDVAPALSLDGKRLAYASRQNGYWDLYLLDLETGEQVRLTDTPEYESAPTLSPDGEWIAYERYNGTSLDIYIQSLSDPSMAPIQLTDDPGIDHSPAWSPRGREIAFVSTRSGDEEIWLARLDNVEDRFINLSKDPLSRDRKPAWSADGSRLAWSADASGDRHLAVWQVDMEKESLSTSKIAARRLGEGHTAAWSADGQLLFSDLPGINETGLVAYTTAAGRQALPYMALPGTVNGMVWVSGPLPAWLATAVLEPDFNPAPALYQPQITRTAVPAGRSVLSALEDVTAPQAMLQDAVDEAFNALRAQVALETGWDALSSLENAYMPLTSPPVPSMPENWLYTGRAFALNPLLLSADWMRIEREDYRGQTFWRVFLKVRYQDGSMGVPLSEMVWDINARYEGDTRAYEQGGRLGQVPDGYWIDFTEMAGRFGWERLPSWINWRTFYPAIRFNQFVITGGLEWRQAMAELYPPEALMTATPLPTYTPTPTRTLVNPPRAATPTPIPTHTQVPTLRPTWTPLR